MAFKHLLEPYQIGGMVLRNRIVMSPMDMNYGTKEGFVTQRTKAYYEARAEGGAGLITIGMTYVDCDLGQSDTQQLSICYDKYIPELRELARVIQQHGAKAAIQLQHAGRSHKSKFSGNQPVAPSSIPAPGGETPRELAVDEIHQIIGRFDKAAQRAKDAGFDGIEIHAAGWYLLAQFLSPTSNKREDAYGGSIENRARLLKEIIQTIKRSLGASYPVWCRLLAYEPEHKDLGKGMTIEDAKVAARIAQDAGADAIHPVSFGFGRQLRVLFPFKPGEYLHFAKEIKREVNIPVIANGSITPEVAEEAIRKGETDLVSMGRALIADPELTNKLAQGKRQDIRHCIRCLYCVEGILQDKPIECAVNPAAGREAEYLIEPSAKVKKVLIVGGGPAGMEVARIAALRGHQVTLHEKRPRLGGMLRLACIFSPEMEKLLKYQIRQVRNSSANIILDNQLLPEMIEEAKPDVVILAAGSTTTLPSITGIHQNNVLTISDMRQMFAGQFKRTPTMGLDKRVMGQLAGIFMKMLFKPSLIRFFSRFWLPFGREVVILGGDFVACEAAEFLSDRGRTVVVVESGDTMASEMPFVPRAELLHKLRQNGVLLLLNAVASVKGKTVEVGDSEGKRRSFGADTVLVTIGLSPNTELYKALLGKVPELYQVGDCVEPRTGRAAIADAFEIACSL